MFTGLIEDLGRVTRLEHKAGGATLGITTAIPTTEVVIGDSIAVNGACLTVTAIRNDHLSFDVSLESLDRTALGQLTSGDRVHLERALRMGSRLDGHLVQGHVDATATLVANPREGDGWRLTYALPQALLGQVVEKGSIAIDGVSLTIASLSGDRVSVAVVPLTAQRTLLTSRPLGARVHIETDILGKYVERILTMKAGSHEASTSTGVTMALLADHGWLK